MQEQFTGCILSLIYDNPGFLKNMRFSEESVVHLNGYINLQTTRFREFDRLDVIIEKLVHSVEDYNENLLTVNQEHYRE